MLLYKVVFKFYFLASMEGGEGLYFLELYVQPQSYTSDTFYVGIKYFRRSTDTMKRERIIEH